MSDPLAPHSHDPNPDPPSADLTFVLARPDGSETPITVPDLLALPAVTVPDCFIVSTGHGTSGPFAFSGVLLGSFLDAHLDPDGEWSQVEIVSGDGFGTRVSEKEVRVQGRAGQIILAYAIGGAAMTRAQGLVRLIVPTETDDALRQVKWVGRISVK